MVLGALLDSTVSICIEQLAQVLDLAADLGASIGVAHHAATVRLVKTVGLAFDVHVARECLGNRRKGPVRLEAAAARARDERIAGDARLGMVSAAEAAIDDQQLALGADGLLALGGFNGRVAVDDVAGRLACHGRDAKLAHDIIADRGRLGKRKVRVHRLDPGALIGDIGALKGTHQASAGG